MAAPQGRRPGHHTPNLRPKQVSNPEPPDSRPCVLTATPLGGGRRSADSRGSPGPSRLRLHAPLPADSAPAVPLRLHAPLSAGAGLCTGRTVAPGAALGADLGGRRHWQRQPQPHRDLRVTVAHWPR